MCGRFIQYSDPEIYAERFELELEPEVLGDVHPSNNLAPTELALVIRQDGKGRRTLAPLRWGLVPYWSKGPSHKYTMINARAETVAERPAYRAALRERRCLIPAEGFYEWRTRGKVKQPYLIRRADRAPFAMAGLWERWRDPDGAAVGGETAYLESCTIIVTDANSVIRPLHDRMPVILSPEDYADWLDPKCQDRARHLAMLRPAPPEPWVLEEVSPASLSVARPPQGRA